MKTNKILSIYPMPNAILGKGESITIKFSSAITTKKAIGRNINFSRTGRATVQLSSNRKSIIIKDINSRATDFAVSITPFLSDDKNVSVNKLDLTYQYVNDKIPMKLEKGFSMLHARNVTMPISKTKYLIAKVENDKGDAKTIAIDEKEKQVNYKTVLKREAELHLEKYGKLHPTLFNHLKERKRDGNITIALWLKDTRKDFDKSRLSVEQLEKLKGKIKASNAESTKKLAALGKKIASKFKAKVTRVGRGTPIIECTLKAKDVPALVASSKLIEIAFLVEKGGIDDLENAVSIANADTVIDSLGFDGTGIKVAVFENGPDTLTSLDVDGFFDNTQSNQSSHARSVIGIIKNTQATGSNGFAPNCEMYSANDKDMDSLEWAIEDEHCTVINQSFHRFSEASSSGLSMDDIVKDYYAYHYPYPTIIHAAGNFFTGDSDNITPIEDEYVNHKGFNTLSIANHDDTATGMRASSVFRNPSSAHNDRELPELSANGIGIQLFGSDRGSGTSFSSPAVAGTVALLQDANSILKSWPEGNRAILLASSLRNIVNGTWWNDVVSNVDAVDGAGALDSLEAVKIAQQKKNPNNTPSSKGWDTGSLTNSSFGADGYATSIYKIKVPSASWGFRSELRFTRKVKVALTWTSKVDKLLWFFLSSTLKVDLDLKVFDSNGVQVASSHSWDNSYEIAEFNGVTGETYTIKIKRWSGSELTYYGVAWTVAPLFSFRLINRLSI